MPIFHTYFEEDTWYIIYHPEGTLVGHVKEGNISTPHEVEIYDNEGTWKARLDELGIEYNEEENE
jgi:hypothetical protein